MVSIRDVAVTMCDEPAVREVKRYNAGSSSQLWSSDIMMSGKQLSLVTDSKLVGRGWEANSNRE